MADEDPPERDVKDFKFSQLCKVRVTDHPDSVPLDRGSSIAISSKYGLTFVAIPQGFKVYRTKDFIDQDALHSSDRLQHIITDFPVLAVVSVGVKVTHLSLSCDDLTLAVATLTDHVLLHMFDTRNFAAQVTSPVSPFLTVNVSGGGPSLLDLAWNPVSPKLLVTCLSSGRLDMYEISEMLGIKASADNAKARCVCWSPKGKQLVVGREDGLLVQYDPDLNIKRKWDYPAVFPDQSYQAVDIIWLSTYTFMVAYISSGADCSDQPNILIINGSKDNATTFVNFEDVCYGRGEERLRKYFFLFVQKWDMVLSASSNALETVVVGKHLDQKDTWERWNLDDAARAECPMTDDYEDTFPMGVAVDFSSQTPIPLGDDKVHPPSPLLLVLSTEGVIIPYYMMYTHKDAPPITEPSRPLDTTGIRKSAGGSTGIGSALSARPPSAVKNLFGSGSLTSTQPASVAVTPFSSMATSKPVIGAPTDQSTPKPLFGTGLTTTSDQSAPKSIFGAQQTAITTQSVTKSLFGAEQSSTADQSAPKSIFGSTGGGQSALVSALNSPDSTVTKPSLGFGQTPFSFSSTVPQSGSGSGFSFSTTSGTAATSGSSTGAGITPSLTLGQDTSTAPSFSFLPKSTATDASGSTGTIGLGSLPKKPADASATTQSMGFGFSTAAPAAKPPAATTTVPPPAFGTSVATFGAKTAPAFGASGTLGSGTLGSGTLGAGTLGSGTLGSGTLGSGTLGSGTLGTGTIGSGTSGSGTIGSGTLGPGALGSGTIGSGTLGSGTMGTGFGTSVSAGSLGGTTLGGITLGGTTLGVTSLGQAKPQAAAMGFGTQTAAVKPVIMATTTPAPVPSKPASVPAPTHLHKSSTTSAGLAGYAQSADSTASGLAPVSTVPSKIAAAPREPEASESSQSVDLSYNKSIMDEMKHFEQEMSELKSRAAKADYSIGGREEMSRLKKQAEDIHMYSIEMKSTMKELNKDVQDQTAFCLDMFAAVEESRMRQQMMSDPKYRHLLKSRPLDPGSAERLQHLQQQYQVLDQGVRDVDLILDTQWEDYQNKKKNKTNRLQAPTNDAVYRVVKSNHNIIVAQKAKLSQLEQRLKQLKLHNQTVTWNSSSYSGGDKTELSTLADSLVSTSPVRSVEKSRDNRASSLTSNKLAKLRDHLYRRHVPVVRSTRPENLSMSKIAVEDRKILRSPDKPHPVASKPQFGVSASSGGTRPLGKSDGMLRRPSPGAPATAAFPAYSSGQTGAQLNTVQSMGLQGNQSAGQTGTQFGFTGTAGKPGFVVAAKPKVSPAGTFPPFGSGVGTGQSFSFTAGTDKPPAYPTQQQMIVTKVSEVNGIKLEDITPSGSENDVEETEEDEYDDEEEDDSSGSGTAGPGFGLQYNMPTAGSLTSTPLGTKFAALATKPADIAAPTDTGSLPVGRKLFGTTGQTAGEPFQFGSPSAASGFTFGGTGVKTSKDKETTAPAPSLSWALSTAPAPGSTNVASSSTFAFGQTTGLSSAGQFTFGQAAGSGVSAGSGQSTAGFQFGQAKPVVSTAVTGTEGFPKTASTTLSSQSSGTSVILGATQGPGVAPAPVARSTRDEAPATGPQSSALSTGQGANKPNSIFSQLLSETQGSSSDGSPPPPDLSEPVSTLSSSADVPGSISTAGDTTSKLAPVSSISQPATAATAATSTPAASGFAFGTATAAAATTSSGVFGSQPSTSTTSGLFGSASNGSSIFGSSSASSGTTPLFGTSAAGTTASGLFGTASVSSTTPTFGALASASTATSTPAAAPTSTAASTGLFGSSTTAPATTTVSTDLFGSTASSAAATTTTASTGLFGASTTSTTSSGLFGSSTAASTASTGLFGSTPTSTTASAAPTGLFENASTSTAASSAPTGLFGQPSSSVASGGLFGQTTATTSTGGTGLFGQPSSSSGELFGNQTTSGSSTGLFGSTTTTTTSSTGLFGQPSNETSGSAGGGGLFGSGGSGFGTATSGSGFGSPATSSAGFGASTSGSGFGFGQSSTPGFGKPAFGQATGFGQSPSGGGLFGSAPSSTSSGGESGGMFSGLGGKPTEEKANTNVFGAGQTFGSGSGSGSGSTPGLFGSSGTQSFGGGAQSSSAGPFSGSGSFSGGGQGVGATGFSGLTQPNQGSGFGGAPSFGSPPAFGGAPGFASAPKFGSSPGFGAGSTEFGSAPAFGGGTTFGSPSTSGAQASGFGGFGAAATGSPTFGALAQSTDAPSFGSLAGGGEGSGGFGAMAGGGGVGGFGSPPSFGAQPQQPQGFGGGGSFGSSPSFSGYRG